MMQDEISVCKALEGGDAAASLNDNNAADGSSFCDVRTVQDNRTGWFGIIEKTCQEQRMSAFDRFCFSMFHPMQNQTPSVHEKQIPPGDYFRIRNHHLSKEWLQNVGHRDPHCQ